MILLEVRGITKEFPGVRSLNNVSLEVKKGEVHVLAGENGAGKSTLVNIISGVYQPDAGDIILEGRKVSLQCPRDALKAGIGMIYQELSLVPQMTVAENIFLGREPAKRFGILDKRRLVYEAENLLQEVGVRLSPSERIGNLGIGKRQIVEVIKGVSRDLRLLIMDEPTSALTTEEVSVLFSLLGRVKERGIAIIYISHRLNEIFQIADRVTVLRNGEVVGTQNARELDETKLVAMMTGKHINHLFPKIEQEGRVHGETTLEVKGLTKKGFFDNISFKIKKGEILGIVGLMGAGRTEILETLYGLRQPDRGEIYLHGKQLIINSPRDALRNGLILCPEDRKTKGLNLVGSVRDNITLAALGQYCTLGVIRKAREKNVAEGEIKKFNIRTPSINQIVKFLSGGNQQKIVFSKYLLLNASVVMLDEPTRGIDVGAKSEIYSIISWLAQEGKSIIFVSSEIEEVIGLSDRIIVLFEGRIVGEFQKEEFDEQKIMLYATGKKGG